MKLNKEKLQADLDIANKLANDISERADYILRYICKKLGGQFNWWDISSLTAGIIMDGDFTPDDISWNLTNNIAIIKGREWDFRYGSFPTDWFFEDFEIELEQGITQYKEYKECRKTEQTRIKEAKKLENKLLKEQAIAKLTPAEIKALKL